MTFSDFNRLIAGQSDGIVLPEGRRSDGRRHRPHDPGLPPRRGALGLSRLVGAMDKRMKNFLERIWRRLFSPITESQAISIARHATALPLQSFSVCRKLPLNCSIYNPPVESCWVVQTSWNDGKDGSVLRSSRLLLISKQSGEVLYDGSANDEG